jgi:hypothetical protein
MALRWSFFARAGPWSRRTLSTSSSSYTNSEAATFQSWIKRSSPCCPSTLAQPPYASFGR